VISNIQNRLDGVGGPDTSRSHSWCTARRCGRFTQRQRTPISLGVSANFPKPALNSLHAATP
jgi:hypothetical protein